ncbi:MAG: hypothetical protein H7Z40_02055 [Phycisphaerae bacterium]|nr:hypothetical protein [Gemmatimonadaceae bacterium]
MRRSAGVRSPVVPFLYNAVKVHHFVPEGHDALSDLGFRGRIEKPYSVDTLASAVARHLEPLPLVH